MQWSLISVLIELSTGSTALPSQLLPFVPRIRQGRLSGQKVSQFSVPTSPAPSVWAATMFRIPTGSACPTNVLMYLSVYVNQHKSAQSLSQPSNVEFHQIHCEPTASHKTLGTPLCEPKEGPPIPTSIAHEKTLDNRNKLRLMVSGLHRGWSRLSG